MKSVKWHWSALKSAQQNVLKSSKFRALTPVDVIIVFIGVLLSFAMPVVLGVTATMDEKAFVVKIESESTTRLFKLGTKQAVLVEGPEGKTKVEIGTDFVKVTYSSCKDKLCLKQGKINEPGEIIVCLPNKVRVSIEGETVFDFINH